MMNQIIDKPQKRLYSIEISSEIAEIPYLENLQQNSDNKFSSVKQYIKKNRYRLQFFISLMIAIIFLGIFSLHIYQSNKQEKISKDLLNSYSLTTLYPTRGSNTFRQQSVIIENPFVIGMIKIPKLDLNYPILSECNEDLLKISLCRFAGPMPNEVGNLCIAGHNYADNKFFSRLAELENNDLIEIYDLSGNKIVYSVFDKYEVDSNDLSCANQDANDKRIVTLLTCNNVNGKRTVVKAKEKS